TGVRRGGRGPDPAGAPGLLRRAAPARPGGDQRPGPGSARRAAARPGVLHGRLGGRGPRDRRRRPGGAGRPAGSRGDQLLLHGGPAMSDYMGLLAPELDGWQAIRYQQRGLPPSAETGPFTVEQHVADAVAVLDELGVDRAVALGHSWGGHLALHLAVAHP